MNRARAAVALYIAIVAHLLVVLVLLLGRYIHLPQGQGDGLQNGEGGDGRTASTPIIDPSIPLLPVPERTLSAAPAVAPAKVVPRSRAQPRSAAAAGGSGSKAGGGDGYLAAVRAHLSRYRYETPGMSGFTGEAQLGFRVDADGAVRDLRLVSGSGNHAFDIEALALVARASPLPPPPGGRARELIVPVRLDID